MYILGFVRPRCLLHLLNSAIILRKQSYIKQKRNGLVLLQLNSLYKNRQQDRYGLHGSSSTPALVVVVIHSLSHL